MGVGFQQIKTGPFPLLARIQTPAKTKTYRNSLQNFKTKFSFFGRTHIIAGISQMYPGTVKSAEDGAADDERRGNCCGAIP